MWNTDSNRSEGSMLRQRMPARDEYTVHNSKLKYTKIRMS